MKLEGPVNKMIEWIFGENFLATLADNLTKIPTDFPDTWKIIGDVYDTIFVPLGWCLMFMVFLIHLIDNAAYKDLTPEIFLKQVCKLILSAALIANGLKILTYFFELGAGLVAAFSGLSGVLGSADNQTLLETMTEFAKTETNNYDFIPALIFCIELLVPLIVTWLIQVVASVICYSRILELMLKTLFAPIPLCDVFSDSYGNSASMRYFRGYVATCLQAVVIYSVGFIFSQVSVDWITNVTAGGGFSVVLGYLAMNLAAVLLIVKSGSMAKELCGAA